jgi:2-polyprenyl-6-hydroxyphenyl methylase/3-demethylubiquinone-9 3-methyltransferase
VNVRDYYERYWSADGFHPTGKTTPALARVFERWVPAGARCLDVGCGDGRTSGLWLLDHGCSYEGVDVSAKAVEEARALGLQAACIDDASRLPFEDGSFDVVVCVEVLEHLFAPLDSVREMARVLRPGGLLIVTVPNVAYWRRRVDMVLLGRWNPVGDDRSVSEPWRDPHIRFFNPGSIRRIIAAAGLSPVVVGAHAGGVLRDVPWLSQRFRHDEASRPYRWLERVLPSLFGAGVYAVARLDVYQPQSLP